VLYYLSIRSQ